MALTDGQGKVKFSEIEGVPTDNAELDAALSAAGGGGGLPYKLYHAYVLHNSGSSSFTVLHDDIGVVAAFNWSGGDKFTFTYSDYKKIIVKCVSKDGTIVFFVPSYQSNKVNINLYDSTFSTVAGEYYIEIISYE